MYFLVNLDMEDIVDGRNDTLTSWDILQSTCSKNFLHYVSSLEVVDEDAASAGILLFVFVATFAYISFLETFDYF